MLLADLKIEIQFAFYIFSQFSQPRSKPKMGFMELASAIHRNDHVEIVQLCNAGYHDTAVIVLAIQYGYADIVRTLINHGMFSSFALYYAKSYNVCVDELTMALAYRGELDF